MENNIKLMRLLEQSKMNEFELRCLCSSLLHSMQMANNLSDDFMEGFISDIAFKFNQTKETLKFMQ